MLELIKTVLSNAYNFMDSIKVPGFNISFMAIFMGAVGAMVSIGLLKMIFGLGDSTVSSIHIGRAGNNKNIKISNERKGDRH